MFEACVRQSPVRSVEPLSACHPVYLYRPITVTVLPTQLPSGLQGDPNIASAFNICLELAGRIQADIDSGKDMEKQMIYCRILALGYLWQHVPSQNMDRFVQEIVAISCQHERLLKIGELYTITSFDCSSPTECIHHPHQLTRLYLRLTNSNSQM